MNIGLIAGSFDVIHPGYIHTFKEIAQNEQQIWVLLDCNNMENRPNKIKPILSPSDRKNTLLQIKGIHQVFTYNSEDQLLSLLNHIHITHPQNTFTRYLGDDYSQKDRTTYSNLPNEKLAFINRSHGWSTTKFKKMITHSICQNYNPDFI